MTVRTRTRAVEGNTAVAPETMSMDDQLLNLWKLKVQADTAADAYDEAKKALMARMVNEKKVEHTVDGLRDRPSVVAKITHKTTNIIDPAKFAKLVSRDQFLECVTVGVTAAKKFATETALGNITTSKNGADYLEVKAKGKAK